MGKWSSIAGYDDEAIWKAIYDDTSEHIANMNMNV